MARTFPEIEIEDGNQPLAGINPRPNNGSGKASTKGRPKSKNSFLSLAKMQAGLNIRLFPHDHRLALMILYAKPDHVRTVTCQVFDALKTGKTCLISSSKGYRSYR